MFSLISILVVLVCVLLLLIVLIQNPKGGLDSAFSSNNQVMGVRKTADFLEKATWTLGIALVVLSIFSSAIHPDKASVSSAPTESKIQEQVDNQSIAPEQFNNAPQQLASPPKEEEN